MFSIPNFCWSEDKTLQNSILCSIVSLKTLLMNSFTVMCKPCTWMLSEKREQHVQQWIQHTCRDQSGFDSHFPFIYNNSLSDNRGVQDKLSERTASLTWNSMSSPLYLKYLDPKMSSLQMFFLLLLTYTISRWKLILLISPIQENLQI